jgi:hypothetical protein
MRGRKDGPDACTLTSAQAREGRRCTFPLFALKGLVGPLGGGTSCYSLLSSLRHFALPLRLSLPSVRLDIPLPSPPPVKRPWS